MEETPGEAQVSHGEADSTQQVEDDVVRVPLTNAVNQSLADGAGQ